MDLQELLSWLQDGFNGTLLTYGGAVGAAAGCSQSVVAWLAGELSGQCAVAMSCWELGNGGELHDLLKPDVQTFSDAQPFERDPLNVEVMNGDEAATLLHHALHHSQQPRYQSSSPAGAQAQGLAVPHLRLICRHFTGLGVGFATFCLRHLSHRHCRRHFFACLRAYSAEFKRMATLHACVLASPCQQDAQKSDSATRTSSAEMSSLSQLVQDLARTGTAGEAAFTVCVRI